MTYLIVKSLHLISMVAWFAGLFYIYRLFVYHVANANSAATADVLSTMERKLLRYIMAPAGISTIAFGTTLIVMNPSFLNRGWLWTKLVLVVALLLYHLHAYRTHRAFSEKRWILTERQCRIINEVPTLLLIAIVFLAVLKPF